MCRFAALGHGEERHNNNNNNTNTTLALRVQPSYRSNNWNGSDQLHMGLEDLAPTAMLKIEALALEGLKVQAEMAEQDAPYAVEPVADESSRRGGGGTVALRNPGRKRGDFMSMDEWMRRDADQEDEEQTVAKPSWKGGGGRKTFMDSTVTLAMLVHLRDPVRNNEPVGAPMIALVQAERVLSKPAARRRRSSSSISSEQEKSVDEDPPQFKIVDITIAGLRTETTSSSLSTIWGSQKQLAAGSRWLAAHGMAKATSRTSNSFKTSSSTSSSSSKPVAVSKSALWSMSDRVYGSGARWRGAAAPLHPHMRNPDVLFADTSIRTF